MNLKNLFLYLLALTILLQACSLNSRIKKADRFFSQGEYFEASKLYRNVYSTIPFNQKPLRGRIAFQEGECYRLINYSRAQLPYNNAIRNKYADSIVYLRFAQVLQRSGKYGEALKNYAVYLKKDSTNLLAKNGLEACQNVVTWKKIPSRYIIHKADLFNVRSADNFSPAFMNSDADALVFTSSRQINKKIVLKSNAILGIPNNNLFMSRKDIKGKWSKPVELGEEINTMNDDKGVCTFSSDGKIMYFTKSVFSVDGSRGTEIMMSNKAGETWSKPKKIKIFKDSTISVAHPALSPDGQTLYFVSDSKKGLGGKDIWKGTLENGECKYVENLGPEINTQGD
jgi:peptidoglycan-associated lipoprotein